MNDTTIPVDETTVETAPEQPEEQPQDENPTEPENERETPGREAAKYRRQLRETEAERDSLRTRVEELQQSIALEQASAAFDFPGARAVKLHHPEDLFGLGGAKAGDLFTEDGKVDEAAVRKAAAALHEVRPELFYPTIGPNPAQAAGNTVGVENALSRWESAFRPYGD